MSKSAHISNRSAEFFSDGILAGDITVLSRAITLVESARKEHRLKASQVIEKIVSRTGKSFRLGVSGAPGVGKSTFIESYGEEAIRRGHRVAVLAVDPSSSKTGGSILGDKTRMENLSRAGNAFVRPSPSRGALGGATRVTYESMLMCEAAGFDYIIVETVGVGQSEISVSRFTDFFLLLMLAGGGDELQGIKRGIMEVADALVITKSDGDNKASARAARAEFARAMHLFPPADSGWVPPVLACSSTEGTGISEVYEKTEEYRRFTAGNGYFVQKRGHQLREIFREALDRAVLEQFYSRPEVQEQLKQLTIKPGLSPYSLVDKLFSGL